MKKTTNICMRIDTPLTNVSLPCPQSPSTVHNWLQNTNHKAWELTPNNTNKIVNYIPSSKEFKQL